MHKSPPSHLLVTCPDGYDLYPVESCVSYSPGGVLTIEHGESTVIYAPGGWWRVAKTNGDKPVREPFLDVTDDTRYAHRLDTATQH